MAMAIDMRIIVRTMIEISKNNPKLNIITSVKKFVDSNKNKNLNLLLNKDIFATNVYTIGYDYDSLNNLDFKNGIIKF